MFHATVPCVKSFSLCRLSSIVQAYIPSGASRRRKKPSSIFQLPHLKLELLELALFTGFHWQCGLRPNTAYTSKTTSWLSGVVPSKFAEELIIGLTWFDSFSHLTSSHIFSRLASLTLANGKTLSGSAH